MISSITCYLFQLLLAQDDSGKEVFSNQNYHCKDLEEPKTTETDSNFALIGYPGSGNTLLWYILEIASGLNSAFDLYKGNLVKTFLIQSYKLTFRSCLAIDIYSSFTKGIHTAIEISL